MNGIEYLYNKHLSQITPSIQHYACFLDLKGDVFKFFYGINDINRPNRSIHAECVLINKIHRYNLKHKLKPLHLLVVRYNKTNKLGSSRPCKHCLIKLQKSGLNIKYVYYSINTNILKKEVFRDMLNDKNTYISNGNKYRSKT